MSRLPLIIGHRGASALAPENTLAAFRRAIADGADGIEFDVRLSRDGVAVVIHDATLKRTGSQQGNVSELTAAELQLTDVGQWFTKSVTRPSASSKLGFSGETVPLLRDVFELFEKYEGLLYLEMKAEVGTGPELAAEVVRMIRQTPIRDRVIVECFDLSLLEQVKKIDSTIRTAALFEPKLSRPTHLLRRDYPRLTAAVAADEIALHHQLATQRTIEAALRLNQRVVVWTVDNPDWVARARSMGITALITNDPSLLLAARDSTGV
jgi:glycerophosphoryl diester phosphodiesterase